jgi:hypothetical protein
MKGTGKNEMLGPFWHVNRSDPLIFRQAYATLDLDVSLRVAFIFPSGLVVEVKFASYMKDTDERYNTLLRR